MALRVPLAITGVDDDRAARLQEGLELRLVDAAQRAGLRPTAIGAFERQGQSADDAALPGLDQEIEHHRGGELERAVRGVLAEPRRYRPAPEGAPQRVGDALVRRIEHVDPLHPSVETEQDRRHGDAGGAGLQGAGRVAGIRLAQRAVFDRRLAGPGRRKKIFVRFAGDEAARARQQGGEQNREASRTGHRRTPFLQRASAPRTRAMPT